MTNRKVCGAFGIKVMFVNPAKVTAPLVKLPLVIGVGAEAT